MMTYAASVKEIRAMEIGVAAAHTVGGVPCPAETCNPCVAWGERVRAVAAARVAHGAMLASSPLAVACAVLLDELRREADEAEARTTERSEP